MRLSIIVPDKAVYKDYEVYLQPKLPTGTPANVFALQWLDDSGHIEFNDMTTNEIISTLPAWTDNALAAWQTEKERVAAEEA
jgi:hypothetical protein